MSRERILRKLEKLDPETTRFVWLKRQLSDQVADKIRSLGFEGLKFREEGKRFYPKGALGAHIIGFVGVDNIGLDGIEKAYDSYMQGDLQEFVIQKDRKGRALIPRGIGYDERTSGYDVVLTIDEVIQHIAEKELRIACKRWEARGGSVIIMNPGTGAILALANYPTYDLNKASSIDDSYKRNRAIRDLYEPGSFFKIVTAAAVINEHLVTPEEQIDCENGVYEFDGYTIHDAGKHNRITFSEVVEQSSNIGIIKVASRLGDKRLYDYIQAFGLTGKTGVDLAERGGFVRPLEQWTKRSMVAVPFGHEIAITSLQALCSANIIANDGVMMKPYIVQAIMDDRETLIEFSPQEGRTPISRETARVMKQILTRAVENGTGMNARVYGYKVAGKTGTAQKASGEGGYMPGKYVSSFTGFLWGKDMMISMIVVIDEPRGTHTGGAVACPVFSRIGTQVMQYLTIGQRSYAAGMKPAN
jgi:cell division protein FtsI (penicillin-binding protein 3)